MLNLRIGCRSSKLAMMQTDQAGAYICSHNPGAKYEKVNFSTAGDKISGSLKRAGGKGLFVREVDAALLAGEINLAIHCLKDVPGNEPVPSGTHFAGYLPRADHRDIFISDRYESIAHLPEGALVGTSSPRRVAQIRRIRPDLRFDLDFRGGIDSRIAKMRSGVVDATILAAAGLDRASLWEKQWRAIDPEMMLPAIGQGTLVLQCMEADIEVTAACQRSSCEQTAYASMAERECLRVLNGDCFSAIAGICEPKGDGWTFSATVFSIEGSRVVSRKINALQDEGPEALGARVAQELLDGGAREILDGARVSHQ